MPIYSLNDLRSTAPTELQSLDDNSLIFEYAKRTGADPVQVAQQLGVQTGANRSALGAGLSSGTDDFQGLMYSAGAAVADAVGAKGTRDALNRRADINQFESRLNGRPDLERVEDVAGDPSKWLPYAGYQIAKQVPNIAGTVAASAVIPEAAIPAVAARAGAVLPRVLGGGDVMGGAAMNYAQGVGSLYQEATDGGDPNAGASALAGGVPYALTETLPEAMALGRIKRGSGFSGNMASRMAKSGVTQAATGATSELLQNEMEMAYNGHVNPDDAYSKRLNSGVAGALVEGALGSLGGVRRGRAIAVPVDSRPSTDLLNPGVVRPEFELQSYGPSDGPLVHAQPETPPGAGATPSAGQYDLFNPNGTPTYGADNWGGDLLTKPAEVPRAERTSQFAPPTDAAAPAGPLALPQGVQGDLYRAIADKADSGQQLTPTEAYILDTYSSVPRVPAGPGPSIELAPVSSARSTGGRRELTLDGGPTPQFDQQPQVQRPAFDLQMQDPGAQPELDFGAPAEPVPAPTEPQYINANRRGHVGQLPFAGFSTTPRGQVLMGLVESLQHEGHLSDTEASSLSELIARGRVGDAKKRIDQALKDRGAADALIAKAAPKEEAAPAPAPAPVEPLAAPAPVAASAPGPAQAPAVEPPVAPAPKAKAPPSVKIRKDVNALQARLDAARKEAGGRKPKAGTAQRASYDRIEAALKARLDDLADAETLELQQSMGDVPVDQTLAPLTARPTEPGPTTDELLQERKDAKERVNARSANDLVDRINALRQRVPDSILGRLADLQDHLEESPNDTGLLRMAERDISRLEDKHGRAQVQEQASDGGVADTGAEVSQPTPVPVRPEPVDTTPGTVGARVAEPVTAKAGPGFDIKDVAPAPKPVEAVAAPVPEDALAHAKEAGGRVVWHNGDVALVEGHSMLSGDPVFVGTKGTNRTRVDITKYTGKMFTQDELQQLLDARARAVQESAAALEANPDGPFIDGKLVFADDIPVQVQGVVRGWARMLGLSNVRIVVTTPKSGADMAAAQHGRFRRIGKANLNGDNVNGVMQPLGDGDYHIAVRPNASTLKMLEVLAHELGHIVERQGFKSAAPETQAAIKAAYNEWLAANSDGTAKDMAQSMRAYKSGKTVGFDDSTPASEASGYWRSFGEWFADQVSRWATTQDKPLSVVDQFFKRLADKLKSFFTGEKAKFKPNATLSEWLNSLDQGVTPDALARVDTEGDEPQFSRDEPAKVQSDMRGAFNSTPAAKTRLGKFFRDMSIDMQDSATLLLTMTNDQIADRFKGVKGIDRVFQSLGRMASDANRGMESTAQLTKRWAGLGDQTAAALGRVMQRTTLDKTHVAIKDDQGRYLSMAEALKHPSNRHLDGEAKTMQAFERNYKAFHDLPAKAKAVYEDVHADLQAKRALERDARFQQAAMAYGPALRRALSTDEIRQLAVSTKAIQDDIQDMLGQAGTRSEQRAMVQLRSTLRDIADEYNSVNGPYFPLVRFGNHVVVLRAQPLVALERERGEMRDRIAAQVAAEADVKPEDLQAHDDTLAEMRKELKVLDARVEAAKAVESNYVVEFHERASQAQNSLEAHLAKNPGMEGYWTLREDYYRGVSGATPDFVAKLEGVLSAALDAGSGVDDTAKADAIKAMRDLYRTQTPEASAIRSELRRQGIEGARPDQMINGYARQAQSQAWRTSRLMHTGETTAGLLDMASDRRNPTSIAVLNEMRRRFAGNLQNQDSSRITQLASNVNYFWQLGFNASYFLTNATQAWTTSLPVLAARHGLGQSTKALWDASKEVIALLKTASSESIKQNGAIVGLQLRLTDDNLRALAGKDEGLLKMLQDLTDNGTIDITLKHDLGATARADTGHSAVRTVMDLSSVLATYPEVYNRLATALASYRMEHEKASRTTPDAAAAQTQAGAYAEKIINQTHFNYAAENAPRFMRGNLGRLLFQFRRYQQGMVFLYVKNFADAFKGEKKEVRDEARMALMYLHGAAFAVSGLAGLPIAAPVSLLASAMASFWPDDDEPELIQQYYNGLKDTLGERLGQAVGKGLPAGLNVDLSGKIGQGSIFDPVPFANTDGKSKFSKDYWKEVIVSLAGPTASTAMSVMNAIGLASQGKVVKAAESGLPVALANLARAFEYGTAGISTPGGTELMTPEEFSSIDLAMRAAGFAQTGTNDMYATRSAIKRMEDRRKAVRQDLVRGMAEGEEGDVAGFNDRNPDQAIGYRDVRAFLKRRAEERANMHRGVVVNDRNSDLYTKLTGEEG